MRVSATLLRCIAPPLPPGARPIAAACASSGPIPGPALSFLALASPPPLPTLASLRPSSGPRGGGTPVAIRGEGLGTAAQCGFGDSLVPAVFDLANDALVCLAPPASAGAFPALLHIRSP